VIPRYPIYADRSAPKLKQHVQVLALESAARIRINTDSCAATRGIAARAQQCEPRRVLQEMPGRAACEPRGGGRFQVKFIYASTDHPSFQTLCPQNGDRVLLSQHARPHWPHGTKNVSDGLRELARVDLGAIRR
jgi:hypothetical protein